MHRVLRGWPAIVIAVCVVAACGGGGSGDDAPGASAAIPPPTAPAPMPAPAPAPAAAAPAREVVSTLAGAAFDYVPPALATDAEDATFTIANRPAWAEFDAGTGTLSGTPDASDVGRYANVTIVRDGAKAEFDVEVVASATGVARLAWEPPVVRTDGTPFEDVTGYRVYYGRSPQRLAQALEVDDAGVREAEIVDLPPGTWYFVATAVDSLGAESELSPVVSKEIG